jgi:hypothetical protein
MDKLDKELSYLFEESQYLPKLSFLKDNLKTHRLFKKFIKYCIDFRIKLFEIMDDRYVTKSKENIIRSCYQKRSEIIEKFAKSINNYNQLEKIVLSRKVKILLKNDNQQSKKTESSSPEDTFDIKAGIDKLYIEFKNELKLLETLIELIINNFPPNIIQSYYTSKNQSHKYIEEYIS